MCFLIKLGKHVSHNAKMNPIDFGGQRSKVKVTMCIYGDNIVNTIETKLLCIIFFFKLGRGERMDPIDFGGQRSKAKATVDMYGNNL